MAMEPTSSATFERNGLEQDRDIGEKNGLQ